jgi:hypothetical protein
VKLKCVHIHMQFTVAALLVSSSWWNSNVCTFICNLQFVHSRYSRRGEISMFAHSYAIYNLYHPGIVVVVRFWSLHIHMQCLSLFKLGPYLKLVVVFWSMWQNTPISTSVSTFFIYILMLTNDIFLMIIILYNCTKSCYLYCNFALYTDPSRILNQGCQGLATILQEYDWKLIIPCKSCWGKLQEMLTSLYIQSFMLYMFTLYIALHTLRAHH